VTSASSFSGEQGPTGGDTESDWQNWYKGVYRKTPLLAFVDLKTTRVELANIDLRNSENTLGLTGIFSYKSRITLTASSIGEDSSRFQRGYYGRNESELYLADSGIYGQKTAATILNSRIAAIGGGVIDGLSKALHLGHSSDGFLSGSVIIGAKPIVVKGTNGDSPGDLRQLELFESNIQGLGDSSEFCLSLQWGARVFISQAALAGCRFAYLFNDLDTKSGEKGEQIFGGLSGIGTFQNNSPAILAGYKNVRDDDPRDENGGTRVNRLD